MQVCNDECSARLAVKLSVAKKTKQQQQTNEQKEGKRVFFSFSKRYLFSLYFFMMILITFMELHTSFSDPNQFQDM